MFWIRTRSSWIWNNYLWWAWTLNYPPILLSKQWIIRIRSQSFSILLHITRSEDRLWLHLLALWYSWNSSNWLWPVFILCPRVHQCFACSTTSSAMTSSKQVNILLFQAITATLKFLWSIFSIIFFYPLWSCKLPPRPMHQRPVQLPQKELIWQHCHTRFVG